MTAYAGYATHPGGLRLVGAEMLKLWAKAMGDVEKSATSIPLVAACKDAMQRYLWKGDHYLIYNDTKTGKTPDAVFSPTLNGQYHYSHFAGVPTVFPKENVEKILAFSATRFARSANSVCRRSMRIPMERCGTRIRSGYLNNAYLYTNHQVIWNALTFIYEGRARILGSSYGKNLEISYLIRGYRMHQLLQMVATPGGRESGAGDDEQPSIWNAPAAVLNKDITAPSNPGPRTQNVASGEGEGVGLKMDHGAITKYVLTYYKEASTTHAGIVLRLPLLLAAGLAASLSMSGGRLPGRA